MENSSTNSEGSSKGRPLVVVGSGFAGLTCARELERKLVPEDAELVLASPRDYLLYSPLLSEVATGLIDPRHIAVPLHGVLRRTRFILGDTTSVALDARTCAVRPPNALERVVG
jgi:NADH:ubiquinone reductase (H+-translocating)